MQSKTPLALLLTLSLAACATPRMVKQGQSVATEADLHQITVTQTGARLEVPVAGASGAINAEAVTQLNAIGANYRALGHGPLMVSTPTGSGDADSAARVAQAVRMQLVDGGVSFAAIAGGTYDAAGRASAPVVLTFTRFAAEAPNCRPLWKANLGNSFDNGVTENFGCAVNANLAAMIADPADLNGPRAEDPRDAARRDVVLGKYREGDPSGATRGADERATISNAIQ
jgi:pilus assembly protein CpaD